MVILVFLPLLLMGLSPDKPPFLHQAASIGTARSGKITANHLPDVAHPLDMFSRESLVLMPSPEQRKRSTNDIAIILVPGCMIRPGQYTALARSIQENVQTASYSNGDAASSVWIHVPKQVQNTANPITVTASVRMALDDLQRRGYPGQSAFVGGHSFSGSFVSTGMVEDVSSMHVDGLLHLGCTLARGMSEHSIPCLTVCGDLDGLVRSSRIAEDYYRNVESVGNTNEDQLHHAIVLVEGMNHFGIVEGETPFLGAWRDLEAELTKEESIAQVASAVADFVAYHRQGSRMAATSLVSKINATYDYIQPLIHAMHMEGSYHIDTPCHLFEESDDLDGRESSCIQGSPWAVKAQREICPSQGDYGNIQDEFHQSWWINPLADPPFYHPSIEKTDDNKLNLETVSEPVYEKLDYYVFDSGFFSNAALEIRSKFNSPQSILKASGVDDARYEANDDACSKMNQRTIQWALACAPDRVRTRYQKRGVKLAAGRDIEHTAGPAWIWSYLEFRIADQQTVVVDSHTMSTPLDHPVPFVGGKLYCKLLSPAKALDWMYTDSLRPQTELGKVLNEGVISPMKFLGSLGKVCTALFVVTTFLNWN